MSTSGVKVLLIWFNYSNYVLQKNISYKNKYKPERNDLGNREMNGRLKKVQIMNKLFLV